MTLLILFLLEITVADLWYLFYGFMIALVFVGGIAGAIKSIKGELWTPFSEKILAPRRKRREQFDELLSLVETLKVQIAEIAAEVKTNGGSSLKDSVDRIEKHIDYANAKLRHFDETSPEPIFEMDENANITFANRAMCDLLNADESELLERKWLSKIPTTSERQRVLSEWHDATDNICPIDIQHVVALEGHQRIAVRVQATPRVNRSKELRGFFGTIRKASEKN